MSEGFFAKLWGNCSKQGWSVCTITFLHDNRKTVKAYLLCPQRAGPAPDCIWDVVHEQDNQIRPIREPCGRQLHIAMVPESSSPACTPETPAFQWNARKLHPNWRPLFPPKEICDWRSQRSCQNQGKVTSTVQPFPTSLRKFYIKWKWDSQGNSLKRRLGQP